MSALLTRRSGCNSRRLPLLVISGIAALLMLTACTSLGTSGAARKGIPTPAAAAVVNPTAPVSVAVIATSPLPAATIAILSTPAAIPTVQPAVVTDAGGAVIDESSARLQPPPMPPPGPPPGPAPTCGTRITHIVRRGETLFSIARQYGTSVTAIVRTNRIADSRTVAVGRRLVIVACLADGPPAPRAMRRYVVQAGDNLFRIGLRFGVSAERLRVANRLPNYIISPGQVLVIP
ncbi:MAG: LysM peptidoglycan-binding domain-containing protein [Chloroflexi bacterium]|nr:LysM peptidoglycan-binding domain-containing protein [Chloroflexota bacterium]